MPQQKVLITGITAQNGWHFATCLLAKGYRLHNIERYSAFSVDARANYVYQYPRALNNNLVLHHGTLDRLHLARLIEDEQPDEIYQLGAQGEMAVSFAIPENTDAEAQNTLRLVEVIRCLAGYHPTEIKKPHRVSINTRTLI